MLTNFYQEPDFITPRHEATLQAGTIFSLLSLSDGRLVSGDSKHNICIWDVARLELISTLVGHTHYVTALASLPDGGLASGSSNGMIRIWDIKQKTCIATLSGHPGSINALFLLPNGQLASGSDGYRLNLISNLGDDQPEVGTIYVDIEGGRIKYIVKPPSGKPITDYIDANQLKKSIPSNTRQLPPLSKDIISITSERGHIAPNFNTIRIWDITKGRLMGAAGKCIMAFEHETVNTLMALPDGRLACGLSDNTVRIWDIVNNQCTLTLSGHAKGVSSLTILQNSILASASMDDTIRLWDLTTGQCLIILTADSKEEMHSLFPGICSLTALPNGQLASASHDGVIRVWDVATTECLMNFTGWGLGPATSLALLADGRLAKGCTSGAIGLWDVGLRPVLKVSSDALTTTSLQAEKHVSPNSVNAFFPPETTRVSTNTTLENHNAGCCVIS